LLLLLFSPSAYFDPYDGIECGFGLCEDMLELGFKWKF